MKIVFYFLNLFQLWKLSICENVFMYQPEQIHLSYGDTINEYVVTWSTFNSTGESVVEYGTAGMTERAKGSETHFIDKGPLKRYQCIHKVVLKNLTSNKMYTYHCGSHLGWSDIFWFKTPPYDKLDNWQPTFAIFGDMGNENAQSLTTLQGETQRGKYDVVFHLGDFAYDLDSNDGKVGDEFMRQIEPIAAYIPYMTCPGNHEETNDFNHYRHRFNMPGSPDNMMYSIDIGQVHLISISTEVYYSLQYGLKPVFLQYQWLENDLKNANIKKNRNKISWIVLMGHRPMYCSNNFHRDCSHRETATRVGLPFVKMFGLEQLLYKYEVDVAFWGHLHSYERFWPLYNYTVLNGSNNEPYVKPQGTVHIVSGAAGNNEGQHSFPKQKPEWSAFDSTDYGFTKMKIFNKSHALFQQVSIEKHDVIDSFWLIQKHHLSY